MATHLVTGASGYLGNFTVRELAKKGEKVLALDILEPSSLPEGVVFHKVDILDKDSIDRVMEGVDYVHHNAALVPLKKAGDKFWEVNVEGTKNLVQSALKKKVRHFVHMSSSAVFGNVTAADCPIQTNPPHLKPVEIYGRSKSAGEKIVMEQMDKDLPTSFSIIRPRTIIGTERLGIFQILFEWIEEGRNIYIIGSGKNVFQFVHVDDLIDAAISSAFKARNGIYNIGTDRYGTLLEALENLCKEAGTGSKVRSLPVSLSIASLMFLDKTGLSPLGPWHYLTYHKDYHFCLKKPIEELDWKPKYSNDEMLKTSYNWYLSHKEQFSKEAAGSAHRSPLKQGILSVLKAFS